MYYGVKDAESHIKDVIKEKMNGGASIEDAVYFMKRELSGVKTPSSAVGSIKKAIEAKQNEEDCAPDMALAKLKNFVYKHDWLSWQV